MVEEAGHVPEVTDPDDGQRQQPEQSMQQTSAQPESDHELSESDEAAESSSEHEAVSTEADSQEETKPEDSESAEPESTKANEIIVERVDYTLESPEVVAMAKDTGLSPEAALAVHMGQTTLKRALTNAKKRQALYEFAQEHNLPHSLAGQVMKEQMTVDEAQVRARVMRQRRDTFEHCSFEQYRQTGEPVLLGLHGQETIRAKITDVLKYDVVVDVKGETQELQKHSIKYLYAPDNRKVVNKTLKQEKLLSKNPKGPITKVSQRFRIRDDDLQKVVDLKSHIAITTLEGERIQAEIKLYSKYEIILNLKEEAELVVFRHALETAEAVPLEEVLAAERYQKKMQAKVKGKPGKGPKNKKKKKKRR